jgi:hypothetical protein
LARGAVSGPRGSVRVDREALEGGVVHPELFDPEARRDRRERPDGGGLYVDGPALALQAVDDLGEGRVSFPVVGDQVNEGFMRGLEPYPKSDNKRGDSPPAVRVGVSCRLPDRSVDRSLGHSVNSGAMTSLIGATSSPPHSGQRS